MRVPTIELGGVAIRGGDEELQRTQARRFRRFGESPCIDAVTFCGIQQSVGKGQDRLLLLSDKRLPGTFVRLGLQLDTGSACRFDAIPD